MGILNRTLGDNSEKSRKTGRYVKTFANNAVTNLFVEKFKFHFDLKSFQLLSLLILNFYF